MFSSVSWSDVFLRNDSAYPEGYLPAVWCWRNAWPVVFAGSQVLFSPQTMAVLHRHRMPVSGAGSRYPDSDCPVIIRTRGLREQGVLPTRTGDRQCLLGFDSFTGNLCPYF